MLRAPEEEGVELYDVEYARALAKTKIGEGSMFVPVDRINKLIEDLYEEGYLLAQAHDQESLQALAQAFKANQSIAIERPDLFGTLRFLRPSDTLKLIVEKAKGAGLPVAFLSTQFEKLNTSFYRSGIFVTHCQEEKDKHWFQNYHKNNQGNPKIRLRPKPETKG